MLVSPLVIYIFKLGRECTQTNGYQRARAIREEVGTLTVLAEQTFDAKLKYAVIFFGFS